MQLGRWRLPSILWSRFFPHLRTLVLLFQSNASSGMGVADQCKHTFLELQRKKAHRYVVFRIDEKLKEVIVEKTGGAAESYDDFLASLPEDDCRYAIYDLDFVTEENCQKSKIFFVAWWAAGPPSSCICPQFPFASDISDAFIHSFLPSRHITLIGAGRRPCPGSERRCCTRPPRIGSGESWTASTMRSRPPSPPSWRSKCSETAPTRRRNRRQHAKNLQNSAQ